MIMAKQSPPVVSPRTILQVTKRLSIPPRRRIPCSVSTGSSVVQDDLDKARRAWKRYQSTRRRDAIYDYLSEVFTAVRRWKRQDSVKARVHQALKAAGQRITIRTREPFDVVVFCTSDADSKTRSKWSRALRFVEGSIAGVENLTKFMKRQGGINECAGQFSNRRR